MAGAIAACRVGYRQVSRWPLHCHRSGCGTRVSFGPYRLRRQPVIAVRGRAGNRRGQRAAFPGQRVAVTTRARFELRLTVAVQFTDAVAEQVSGGISDRQPEPVDLA